MQELRHRVHPPECPRHGGSDSIGSCNLRPKEGLASLFSAQEKSQNQSPGCFHSLKRQLLSLFLVQRHKGDPKVKAGTYYARIVLLVLLCLMVGCYSLDKEVVTPDAIAHWSTDKTFVVTGANSEVATGVIEQLLVANTARHIVMTCRTRDKCQQAKSHLLAQVQSQTQTQSQTQQYTRVSTVSLDLTSRDSIQQCAHEILQLLFSDSNNGGTTTAATAMVEQDVTLVWNANDYTHDPLLVNAGGHLYLTHFLYPRLQRLVVVGSLLGGLPWNILPVSNSTATATATTTITRAEKSQSWWPVWFQPVAQYGAGKRAVQALAKILLEQQPPGGADNSNRHNNNSNHDRRPLQVVVTQPGLTRDDRNELHGMTMTPEQGAKSHLRAMLDPDLRQSSFVGHRWILWGSTAEGGSFAAPFSLYHLGLFPGTCRQFWNWSLQQLQIPPSEFGQAQSKSAI